MTNPAHGSPRPFDDAQISRRALLGAAAAAATASAWLPAPLWAAEVKQRGERRPKIAAVFTELRFRSHAYNILENFFQPYLFRGELVDPGCDVVSFYADQFPDNDMSRDVSRQLGIPLYDTIEGAMCRGGERLAVDGVLLIGEHGDYPNNELGQKMYPRKEFFDQIIAPMRRAGRGVPVFNDKHLSYRWDWAKQMYDTAQELKVPMLAGSSVPLGERRPMIEVPPGSKITEAVVVHGGGLESYDFHGLEVLQSLVEGRAGGETGISQVQLLSGEAYVKAYHQGRFSRELLEAALAAEQNMGVGRQQRPRVGGKPLPISDAANPGNHVLLVTYRDGLKAAVVKHGSSSDRWDAALRIEGRQEPLATAIYNGPWGNRCLFKALSHSIQHLFITAQPPYPVERTLMVSGALDAAIRSHVAGGKPWPTPFLEFGYKAKDFSAFRENGASWKLITVDTPQPTGFEPGDARLLPQQAKPGGA